MLRAHFKNNVFSLITLKLKLILLTVNRVTSSFKFLQLVILYFHERPSGVFGIKTLNGGINNSENMKVKISSFRLYLIFQVQIKSVERIKISQPL